MIFLSSLLTLGLVVGLFDLFDSRGNDDDDGGTPPDPGLTGTEGNDTLAADSGDARGLGGNDLLDLSGTASGFGGAGDDTLDGGTTGEMHGDDGDDELTSYDGDFSYGDAGNDQLYGQGNMYGGVGTDSIQAVSSGTAYGGNGGDDIIGSGLALVYGGDGNDSVTGGSTPDNGPGDTTVYGGAGDDELYGGVQFGQGGSLMTHNYGGAGSDFLRLDGDSYAFGGEGDDTFSLRSEATGTGGEGADTFLIVQNSSINPDDNDPGEPEPIVIRDFVLGTDRLQIDMNAQADAATITETANGTTIRVPWAEDSLLSENDPSEAVIYLRGVTGLTLADLEFVQA